MIEGESHSIKHENNQRDERRSSVTYKTAGTLKDAVLPAMLSYPDFQN